MPDIRSRLATLWQDAAGVRGRVATSWQEAAGVKSRGSAYVRPPAPPGGTEITPGSLVPRTEILAKTSYDLPATWSLIDLRNDAVLQCTSFSLGIDDGSAMYSASFSGPYSLLEALDAGEQPANIQLRVGAQKYSLVVDGIDEPVAFASSNVTVTARSLCAAADAPFSLSTQWTIDAPTTAAQLANAAQTNTGLAIGWEIDDWLIPAGAWSGAGTPLDVIRQLAAAAEAVIEPMADQYGVIVRSRYATMPNQWHYTAPDVQVAWPAVESSSRAQADQPDYTAIYVAGQQQGLVAQIRLEGTSGADQAPMVTDALLTDLPVLLERGKAVLAASGQAHMVTRVLPVLMGAGDPGVFLRGQLVRWVDPKVTWVGAVRSVSVTGEFGKLRQTVTCERRMSFPAGTFVPVVPPSTRPPYLFDAPLTESAADAVDPPAPPTIQNLVSFSPSGALVVWGGASFSSSSIYYFSQAKLNATLNADRFSMLVKLAVDPAWFGPSGGGAHRVFGFSGGPIEVAFAFWASGTTLKVYPWAYNGNPIAGPGQAGTPEAVVLPESEYEIQWTGADTCTWSVDGVVLYEIAFPRISSGTFYLSNGLYRNGPTPLSIRFKDLRVYNGPLTGPLKA
jgi:hypothetical protein